MDAGDADATRVDVLIAGAGPTALTLALELASYDVSCVLVGDQTGDASSSLHGEVVLDSDAVAILDRLTTGAVREHGCAWTSTRITVGRLARGGDSAAGTTRTEPKPLLNITPADLSSTLRAAVADSPRVTFAPAEQVIALRQGRATDEGHVSVTTQDASGDRRSWRPRFVVGADGNESPVRDLLGLPFDGPARGTLVRTIEIETDAELPVERSVVIDPDGGGWALEVLPLPRRQWRLRWVLADGDPAATPAPAELDGYVRAVLGDAATFTVLRAATEVVRHRLAPRFSVDHVFLAGAAAHTFEPAGGRSLSSGIQDAENLGWKLAYAAHGHAGEPLLESYSSERRRAAHADLEQIDAAMAILAPRDRWARLRRRALLAAPGMRVDIGAPPTPPIYRESPMIQPGCGGLAPELPVRDLNGWSGPLGALRGGPMVVVAIGSTAQEAHELVAPIPSLLPAAALPPFRLVAGVAADATDGIDLAGAALGNFLIIRPDGHFAWKVNGENDPTDVAENITAVLQTATGR